MKNLQEAAQGFLGRHGLETGVEARVQDLMSEVGELAKKVRKATRYGHTAFASSPAFPDELGDVLFSLICLANAGGVDLKNALDHALAKYEARIRAGDTPGSEAGEKWAPEAGGRACAMAL